MRFKKYAVLLGIAAILSSCGNTDEKQEEDLSPLENLSIPENQWVKERVEGAKKRMNDSEGGGLVWKSINAHGGLERWYKNGPLAFRFNYQPIKEGTNRDTYQIIDTWSSRAVHQPIGMDTVSYGWNGKDIWTNPPNIDLGYDIRFWALTPYYFVAIPFVFADEGIHFELLPDIFYNSLEYKQLKVTFEDHLGDAPDDYYILYIHPESYEVDAIRYIVSYPEFFPDGGHSPEKLMTYEDEIEVEGILLHRKHRTHKFSTDSIGEQVTDISVSKIEFRPEIKNDYFNPPQ